MSPSLLQARNLRKAFAGNEVLRSVDLDIEEGERIALIGPSGSGKSTLLNCLGGLERCDEGEIHFHGQALHRLSGEALAAVRKEHISSVFQFFHLLPTLTAEENIEFPLRLLDIAEDERRRRVSDLIDEVQLTARRHALPGELSGGEQQRVALARALVIRPKLILADEPTGNLDQSTGAAILELMARLTEAHQTALLLVTHSEEATRICQRTLRMRDGTLSHAEPACA